MSYRHINAAREVEGLDPTAKLILLTIATYTDERGRAWCSWATLMRNTGLNRGTVWRALKRITATVPITITPRHGQTPIYDIHKLVGGSRTATQGVAYRDIPVAPARPNQPSVDIAGDARLIRQGEAALPLDEMSSVPPAATQSECPDCGGTGWRETADGVVRCPHRPTGQSVDPEKSRFTPEQIERALDPAAIERCVYCDENGYLWRVNSIRARCTHQVRRHVTDLIVPPEWTIHDGDC